MSVRHGVMENRDAADRFVCKPEGGSDDSETIAHARSSESEQSAGVDAAPMKNISAALCLKDSDRMDFLPPDLFEELEQLFPRLVLAPVEKAWNIDSTFFKRVEPEILVTGWETPRLPDRRSQMPSVKYVCHLAGTVRGLVPRNLLEEGLLLSNWGTCHAPTVAECALLLALSALRRTTASAFRLHSQRDWLCANQLRPNSLYGRRVGLHGFGAVARCLLPLLKPFGVSISAFSHGVPSSVFRESGVREASSLEELFQSSDVLIEVEAASLQNRGSVREEHLRSLPDGAVFVNVGRAEVVDEAALLKIAVEGKLQMGLDVCHQEPLPTDSPLYGLPNVCLLAHQAGPTPDRRRDCGRWALDNLKAYLSGQSPKGHVTLEVFDRGT